MGVTQPSAQVWDMYCKWKLEGGRGRGMGAHQGSERESWAPRGNIDYPAYPFLEVLFYHYCAICYFKHEALGIWKFI